MFHKEKYLKYKKKYLALYNQDGGLTDAELKASKSYKGIENLIKKNMFDIRC